MSKNQQRLGPLDPENRYSVYATAVSLMALFADALLEIIDERLTLLYGKDWQAQLVDLNLLQEDQNLRDVQALLKELARNGMSQLRMPLSERIPKKDDKKIFYDELANILAERNAWVHRKVQETREELKGLAELVKTVSNLISISTEQECEKLIRVLTSTKEAAPVESMEEKPVEQPAKSIPKEASEKVWAFGDTVNLQFTSHSYLITDQYDVADRITGLKLSETNPDTHARMFDRLQKLRPGSRLRITGEGVVSAFFSENWGFVEKVSAEQWFPKHLN